MNAGLHVVGTFWCPQLGGMWVFSCTPSFLGAAAFCVPMCMHCICVYFVYIYTICVVL